jgi:heme/copper-type cytochrome/quinol oxidase subunit 2
MFTTGGCAMLIKSVCKWIGAKWVLFHVTAVLWLVAWTLVYSYVSHPSMDNDAIIYTKIHLRTYSAYILILPPLLLVFGSSIFNIFLNHSVRPVLFYFIAPVVAIAGFLAIALFGMPSNPHALGATVYGLPDPETGELIYTPRIEHLQSVTINGHVYNFLRYEKPTMNLTLPLHHYNLYQCDALGISCDVIFRYPLPTDTWDSLYANLNIPPQLVVEGDTLVVFVAGERVYTYPLP